MKKFPIFIFTIILVTGCSNDAVKDVTQKDIQGQAQTEPEVTEKSSANNWEEIKVTDSFGDDTGKRVMAYTTEGTFSNSATGGSGLTVRMVDYGINEAIQIELYEYNSNAAAMCYDNCSGWVNIKYASGEVQKFSDILALKGGGLYLPAESDLAQVIRSAKESGEQLKFLINQNSFTNSGNAKYQFTLN